MIVYTEKIYDATMRNIIILDCSEGGFIYVDKDTYTAAIKLQTVYNNDLKRIADVIGQAFPEYKQEYDTIKAVEKLQEVMPEPLNVLAIYIGATWNDNLNWRLNNCDMVKQACGILNQMGKIIDFFNVTQVPPEVRKSIKLPKSAYIGYEADWDTFFTSVDRAIINMNYRVVEIPSNLQLVSGDVPLQMSSSLMTQPAPVAPSIPVPKALSTEEKKSVPEPEPSPSMSVGYQEEVTPVATVTEPTPTVEEEEPENENLVETPFSAEDIAKMFADANEEAEKALAEKRSKRNEKVMPNTDTLPSTTESGDNADAAQATLDVFNSFDV